MINNYRIIVDDQFYTGETEVELNTWTVDPHSQLSFQTNRQNRNVLTFDPTKQNFKIIVGYTNLMSEIKKILEFIRNTELMAGNRIVIENLPIPPMPAEGE